MKISKIFFIIIFFSPFFIFANNSGKAPKSALTKIEQNLKKINNTAFSNYILPFETFQNLNEEQRAQYLFLINQLSYIIESKEMLIGEKTEEPQKTSYQNQKNFDVNENKFNFANAVMATIIEKANAWVSLVVRGGMFVLKNYGKVATASSRFFTSASSYMASVGRGASRVSANLASQAEKKQYADLLAKMKNMNPANIRKAELASQAAAKKFNLSGPIIEKLALMKRAMENIKSYQDAIKKSKFLKPEELAKFQEEIKKNQQLISENLLHISNSVDPKVIQFLENHGLTSKFAAASKYLLGLGATSVGLDAAWQNLVEDKTIGEIYTSYSQNLDEALKSVQISSGEFLDNTINVFNSNSNKDSKANSTTSTPINPIVTNSSSIINDLFPDQTHVGKSCIFGGYSSVWIKQNDGSVKCTRPKNTSCSTNESETPSNNNFLCQNYGARSSDGKSYDFCIAKEPLDNLSKRCVENFQSKLKTKKFTITENDYNTSMQQLKFNNKNLNDHCAEDPKFQKAECAALLAINIAIAETPAVTQAITTNNTPAKSSDPTEEPSTELNSSGTAL